MRTGRYPGTNNGEINTDSRYKGQTQELTQETAQEEHEGEYTDKLAKSKRQS